MGLMWMPVVIGIQLILLYAVLGGPGALIARCAGHAGLGDAKKLDMLQIGIPVALILAFPSLTALAMWEKWYGSVGTVEVVLAQAVSLLLLLYWLSRRTAPATGDPEAAVAQDAAAPSSEWRCTDPPPPLPPAAVMPTLDPESIRVALTMERPADLPETPARMPAAEAPPSPAPACPIAAAGDKAAPARGLGPQGLLKRLHAIYLWDDIGLGKPYCEARARPLARLIQADEVAACGDMDFKRLRSAAQETLARLGAGEYHWLPDELSPDRMLERYEYESDVMRRLVLSVWTEHERLFVDEADQEFCGAGKLAMMYRLALFEARRLMPAAQAARLH